MLTYDSSLLYGAGSSVGYYPIVFYVVFDIYSTCNWNIHDEVRSMVGGSRTLSSDG